MTFPLMALAVGAIVAGFVGIPAALGGGNAIEHFLEPSFTASAARRDAPERPASTARRTPVGSRGTAPKHEASRTSSRGVELGLMGFSVLIAVVGHLARPEVLRDEPGDFRAARRRGGPARTGCCRTSTTSTSSTTRRSIVGHLRRAAAACGRSIARSSTARSTARAG